MTQKSFHPHLTKIVATVSGEDASRDFLQKLYDLGMDVARLNTAHMSFGEMEKMIRCIREVSPRLAVMVDTKGPNIRTCNIPEGGLKVAKGETVRISGQSGADDRICVNYPSFVQEVPVGSRIVCDDGAVKFLVTGKEKDCLLAEVLFDSVVENKKSVNVPDVSLKAPALTDRDREFLKAAVQYQCDFIAHSFVRNAGDVREVRRVLGEEGREIQIIAKIENREGVDHIQEILQEADGIMVARGDLGIEIPLEEVPAIQKKLIYEARKYAKPVITATQMLQSMTASPLPTRAEVSDVANAVYDGTDAVMLSGETAHGKYPFEAVETMRRIVVEAEKAPQEFFTELQDSKIYPDAGSYLLAAATKAEAFLPVKAIVCSTLSGKSARLCSSIRPKIRVYSPSPRERTVRQLSLSYGVFPFQVAFDESPEGQAFQALCSMREQNTKFEDEDFLAILGKNSSRISKNNMLCIASVAELKEIGKKIAKDLNR